MHKNYENKRFSKYTKNNGKGKPKSKFKHKICKNKSSKKIILITYENINIK